MSEKPVVLIVEDEAELLEIFSFYITDFGYDVLTAGSGEQAFQIIEKCSPDILMTDIKMPESSGIDLINRIKASGRSLPIIICSASLLESEIIAIRELRRSMPIIDMLDKPLDASRLEKALSQASLLASA